MKKEFILNVSGVFLVFIGIFSMFYSAWAGRVWEVIWLCYIGVLLIGVGIFMRKDYLIVSQFNILLIPSLLWSFDFFYIFFTGESLLNLANYFFFEGRGMIENFISLQHLYAIPLAVLGLYLVGVKRKDAWKFSLLEMAAIFVLSRAFTPESANMNCVFRNCLSFGVGQIPYELVWFVVVILGVLLVNLFIIQSTKPLFRLRI